LQRTDSYRKLRGRVGSGRTDARHQHRDDQRYTNWWWNVVFPGPGNGYRRGDSGQWFSEPPDQFQRADWKSGSVPEATANPGTCFAREGRVYAKRDRDRVRFRRYDRL